jgi:hypothetical protein
MLLVLPYPDVFQHCFENTHSPDGRIAMKIIYNPNNKILLSREYLDFLEEVFDNKDFFQGLIKELFDSGRIESKSTGQKLGDIDKEFVALSNLPGISLLIPIAFMQKSTIENQVSFICIKEKVIKPNSHWIKMEILMDTKCIVSHLDFKGNPDIQKYIGDIFSLPRFIKAVSIFDREQNSSCKIFFKHRNIKYFTLFRNVQLYEKRSILNDLQKDLGRKLELWATKNGKLIHERKIIFENLILTCDNSFCNITCDEPTWEITFYYSPIVAKEWENKCGHFIQVR